MLYFGFSYYVKTGKFSTSYRGISDMHTFVSSHPLITIVQSISRVLLVQFGESNRELLRTFVFNKLAFYDVIIPGRASQIPIDMTKLQTKFQDDNISRTMLIYQICNIENGVCPTYKMAMETPKWSINTT